MDMLLVKIDGYDYCIKDIDISESGRVSYDLCSNFRISDDERRKVDEFVKRLISGEISMSKVG